MTPEQIKIVQKSFASSLPRADAIARTFYERLFAADPTLRLLFKADMTEQRNKLMVTLALVVQQLHAIETILPTIRALAQRHVGYGVKPSHYQLVGRALIYSLAEHLPTFGSAERDAWVTSYEILAGEMLTVANKRQTLNYLDFATTLP